MTMPSRWQIDGDRLVSTAQHTYLARVTADGLALWDRFAHCEVVLTQADIEVLLSECAHDPPDPPYPPEPSDR
jgi:hypothetical protein